MNPVLVFILAIINGILIDNVILSRFYGICPFLGVSKKTSSALGMGVAVVFVIVLATLITWPLYNFVLVKAGIPFMDTITFILVIASLVQFVEMFIKKYSPSLYKALGVYLPLITTNCAVLGVAQGNTDQGFTFGQSIANALGTSLGFLLIIFVFSCIRSRLDSMNVPKCLKGVPIALITAALMSLAFLGLSGMINL